MQPFNTFQTFNVKCNWRPKGILVRIMQKNVAYLLDTSPSMAFFLISSPIFLSSLSIFFFCSLSFAVLALYSSMSLLYVLISCSSWLSSLYSSSVPDLLIIQRINITTPSITTEQYLGWEWTSPKTFGIVGTVLAYNVCILEMYWFTERLSLRPWDK